jgi:hypothetical protein
MSIGVMKKRSSSWGTPILGHSCQIVIVGYGGLDRITVKYKLNSGINMYLTIANIILGISN